jgi:hypothetical protein
MPKKSVKKNELNASPNKNRVLHDLAQHQLMEGGFLMNVPRPSTESEEKLVWNIRYRKPSNMFL